MLIAGLVRPVLAFVIDADDIVDAAPVARYADHGAIGRLRLGGCQQISQDRQARPALKDEFLTPVFREFADFERLSIQCAALCRETTQEFREFGAQLLLPRLGLFAALRAKCHFERR